MNRKVILILGMHRSGTSALARTLSFLGCDLPNTLVPETATNPTGHWEPNTLMSFNNEILHSAGSNWYDWLEFNPQWYESPVAENFYQRGEGVIDTEFGDSPLFVLKDPRNCRLTRFWFNVFDRVGIEPLVLIPLRNPLEVAASLEARDGMHHELAMLLWLRHVLDAEEGSRGHKRVFATYDELLSDWAGLAERSKTAFNITWPRSTTVASREVEAFLNNDNRHHNRSSQSVLTSAAVADWVRDADRILFRWAENGEDVHDHATLDQIRQEFNVASLAFSRLARDIGCERQQNTDLQTAIDGKNEELTRSQNEIAALHQHYRQEVEHGAAQVAHHASQAQQLEAKCQALEAALDQEKSSVEVIAYELQIQKQSREDIELQLAANQAAVAQGLSEKELLLVQLNDLRSQVEIGTTALDHERSVREEIAIELCEQQRANENLEHQLRENLKEGTQAETAYATANEALQSVIEEKLADEAVFKTERDRLNRHVAELTALSEDLDRTKADLILQVHTLEQELAGATIALAEREHELTNTQSALRQRDEEIHQTLASLESERVIATDAKVARDAAQNKSNVIQAKLRAADEWVFRLAGDRKAAEDQVLLAVKRADLAENKMNSAVAMLGDLKQRHEVELRELSELLAQAQALDTQNAQLLALAGQDLQRLRDDSAEGQAAKERLSKTLIEREAELSLAQSQAASMQVQNVQQRKQMQELTTVLQGLKSEAGRNSRQTEWLRQVNAIVTGYPRWWTLMPIRLQEKWRLNRLRRRDLFNAEAYLERYPDVRASGIDPLRHYILHGMSEDRSF